jgi:hypothetical protein
MSWRARAFKAWRRKLKRAGVSQYDPVTKGFLDRIGATEQERRRLWMVAKRSGDQMRLILLLAEGVSFGWDGVKIHGELLCTNLRYQGVLTGIS